MNTLETNLMDPSLEKLNHLGLLSDYEMDQVRRLRQPDHPFHDAVNLAETLHLHIKVDNTDALPLNDFFDAGARLDHQKQGFVKWLFPGGVNAIFSHIKVSQDELVEDTATRRPRPFLDHIGIDLRAETPEVRAVFDSLSDRAGKLNLAVASQGGKGQPVFCCHVEISEKHWIYQDDDGEHPGIPLEFAYGQLKVNPEQSGCDLRPMDPRRVDPDAAPACCGNSESASDSSGSGKADHGEGSYYRRSDLGRFGEIGRRTPALAESFFDYYGKVMADGSLTSREKSLIALAVAHALKCPYCIDSISGSCLQSGLSEEEMMEAVHVAGAMAAGVTLVHSTQMLGHIDRSAGESCC